MIEAAIVAMTVLGCSHQDMNCELIQRNPTVWLSLEECEAAIPAEIVKPDDAPYPVIIARCNDHRDFKIAEASAWPEGSDRGPIVIVRDDFERRPEAGQDQTFTGALLYRTKNGYALVRDGASGGFALLRDGAIGGYTHLSNGVKATAGATSNLARRAAGAVRDIVR